MSINQGRWLPAAVVGVRRNVISVHYDGYDTKYDVAVKATESALGQFAKFKSLSNRPNTLLSAISSGDSVEILIDGQWTKCRVIKLDDQRANGKSGQMMVTNGDGYRRWHHPDDISTVRKVAVNECVKVQRQRPLQNEPTAPKERRRCNGDKGIIDIDTVKLERNVKRESSGNRVYDWSVEDVIDWFESIGFVVHMRNSKWRNAFMEEEVDGKTLKILTHQTLKMLGFKMFDRATILKQIRDLR